VPSGLNNLAFNLVDDQLNTVKSFFSNDIEFRLMRKKSIFPYEYLDHSIIKLYFSKSKLWTVCKVYTF